MTQLFPFVPNVVSPFLFQPVLDGRNHAASITWNLFGQRWYINVSQLNGTPVFSLPLIGSLDGTAIEALSWSAGTVTATTARLHRYTPGLTVSLLISGCAPDTYNGQVDAFIVDGTTLTYALAADPGEATQIGNQFYNVNLAAGYFNDSTLVYRESSTTIEVTP